MSWAFALIASLLVIPIVLDHTHSVFNLLPDHSKWPPSSDTMNALVMKPRQGLQSLSVKSLPRPTLRPDEVLICVRYATINHFDLRGLSHMAAPGFCRYIGSLCGMGGEGGGVVVARGELVHNLRVGDEVVFGGELSTPTFAELAAVPETSAFRVPSSWSLKQAAAQLPIIWAPFIALNEKCPIMTGSNVVVILGGDSASGRAAIRFAKSFESNKVFATCDPQNASVCKESGADVVFDASADLAGVTSLEGLSDFVVFEAVSSPRHMDFLFSKAKCSATSDVSSHFWSFLLRTWWRKLFFNYHLVANDRPPLYDKLQGALAAGRFTPSNPSNVFDLSSQTDVIIKYLQQENMSIEKMGDVFEIQSSCSQYQQ